MTKLAPDWIECSECIEKPAGISAYHYVRGSSHTNWCVRCNGDRRVFVGAIKDISND